MKSFTFEDLKTKSAPQKLFCLVSGIRGAGKSTVIGTLGVPTLLICSAMESHAVHAAKVFGEDNIKYYMYDVGEDDKQLKPDLAIANLHQVLDYLISTPNLSENIQCVALDSISAIDKTLIETSRILSEKNGFESMKIMEQEHFRIIKKLMELHRKGVHIIVTMPVMAAFDEEGYYISAKPEIRGVTTTSNIAGIFAEVLVTAKIASKHYFQMNLLFKKSGKDASSGDKKEISFHPRITGLSDEDISHVSNETFLIPADLSYIYKLKLAKENAK